MVVTVDGNNRSLIPTHLRQHGAVPGFKEFRARKVRVGRARRLQRSLACLFSVSSGISLMKQSRQAAAMSLSTKQQPLVKPLIRTKESRWSSDGGGLKKIALGEA